MTEPHERLRRARKEAGFKTAVEAARRFHWNENSYISNENGNAPFGKDAAIAYAQKLSVRIDWLLTGKGPMRASSGGVTVKSYVGAGAKVFPIDDGGFDSVVAPFPVPDGAEAAIVRGDSMWPAYLDGTYLIYEAVVDIAEVIHKRAIVTLEDGSQFVKVIEKGSKAGLFTLTSYNGAPIRDVRIAAAARIHGTVEP